MKKVYLFVFFALFGCQHINQAANPLVGSWRAAPQLTIKVFKSEHVDVDYPVSKKIISYQTYLSREKCGFLTVTYGERNYTTVFGAQKGVSKYSVKQKIDEYVEIDQHDNGGLIKIFFNKDNMNMYVNQTVDGTSYKEFFTKTPCP